MGAGERQLSPNRGVRRHNKMSGSKEDDPITASRDDHAQSKCKRATINNSANIRHSIVLHCITVSGK